MNAGDRLWDEILSGLKPTVTVSPEDRARADDFARYLFEKAKAKRTGVELQPFLLQALGELAFALWLGLPWVPDRTIDYRPAFMGWYVRTRRKPWHGLAIYPSHPRDGEGFVLVTPCMSKREDLHRLIIHGWYSMGEAVEALRSGDGRKRGGSLVVEQERLHRMSELPTEVVIHVERGERRSDDLDEPGNGPQGDRGQVRQGAAE